MITLEGGGDGLLFTVYGLQMITLGGDDYGLQFTVYGLQMITRGIGNRILNNFFI